MTVTESTAVGTTLGDFVHAAWTTSESKGFHEPMSFDILDGTIPLAYQLGILANAVESFRKKAPLEVPTFDLDTLTAKQVEAIMRMLLIVSECWETVLGMIDGTNEAEEVADIAIRLFDYCGTRGIDLDEAVLSKMAKNKDRPYKHGKRF